MSEAPKKIWFDMGEESAGSIKMNKHEIPYIRADIVDELMTTGQAVVDRWDSPLWKDLPHTADYIHKLRAAIAKVRREDGNPT